MRDKQGKHGGQKRIVAGRDGLEQMALPTAYIKCS